MTSVRIDEVYHKKLKEINKKTKIPMMYLLHEGIDKVKEKYLSEEKKGK